MCKCWLLLLPKVTLSSYVCKGWTVIRHEFMTAEMWQNLYPSGNLLLNCENRTIATNVRFVKNESTLWKCVLKVYKDFFQVHSVFKLCTRNLVEDEGVVRVLSFCTVHQLFFQCLLVWNACNIWKSLAAEGAFSSPVILHLFDFCSSFFTPWYKNEWSYPISPTFNWTATLSLPCLLHPLKKRKRHLSLQCD